MIIRLDHVLYAFTGDVVGKICCDDRVEFLDDANFAVEWCDPCSKRTTYSPNLMLFKVRTSNEFWPSDASLPRIPNSHPVSDIRATSE